ncbi:MAG: hypothetical protein HQM12_10630 [SAR324 cluster bacterium]|nr:hypothetical protein [SAR324 cluster bacterium]
MKRLWLGIIIGLFTSGIILAQPRQETTALRWKSNEPIQFQYPDVPESSLSEVIKAYLESWATNPASVQIHPAVIGKNRIQNMSAVDPQSGFEFLLHVHDLHFIATANGSFVLPRSQLWRYQPYQKWIASQETGMDVVLDELENRGQIEIRYEREKAATRKIRNNLSFPSVEEALFSLAKQFEWFVEYHADRHMVQLVDQARIVVKSLNLEHVNTLQVQDFFEKTQSQFHIGDLMEVVYPTDRMVLLKGLEERVTQVAQWIKEFDQPGSVPVAKQAGAEFSHSETILLRALPEDRIQHHLKPLFTHNPVLYNQVSISWNKDLQQKREKGPLLVTLYGEKTAVQTVKQLLGELDQTYQTMNLSGNQVFERVPLRYLRVGDKSVASDGQRMQIPGTEKTLESLLKHYFEGKNMPAAQVVPDLVTNALILQAEPEQIQMARQLIQIWDVPSPQIKIEAHIFETTESYARDIGLQFSGQGVPAGSTQPNINADGPFTAGFVAGPIQTTQAFRVDTLLRLLETEGKGRVLSRPVVTTMNNTEAEMHSGFILNIKIVHETRSELKEIKTGVTLRVTPRLIMDVQAGKPEDFIGMNVFAETSSPVNEATTDGIPQINSQRAQGNVIVRNGNPFLLGGLIRDREGYSESGIPFLREIPLIGWMFQSNNTSNRFDHILVFVTPTLVADTERTTLPDFEKIGKK